MGRKIDGYLEKEGVRCIGKPCSDMDSSYGEYFGWIFICGEKWAIVKWENLSFPSFYKMDCLLIEEITMVPLD